MLKIVELFAGVGGFRLGFENAKQKFSNNMGKSIGPSRKVQHAYNYYVKILEKTVVSMKI